MPRFYFDFCQSGERVCDQEGAEFASAEEAYLEAFKGAQDIWLELLRERRDPTLCHFEILGAERDLLFILPLREVMDSCTDRRPHQPFGVMLHRTLATHAAARKARDALQQEIQSMRKTLADARKLLAEVA